MKRFLTTRVFLFLIIGLALVLRLYSVTSNPPALNWDETSIGYNAFSVLKTGKDEWGQVLPLHFRAYGEFKLPVQIYASIPAIFLLGLSDFSVRLTPVLYGVLTVLFLYLVARDMFKNKSIGLIAAFLLATSPWHIQLTRASFESSFSVLWVLLGVWLFIRAREHICYLKLSVLAFVVSIYTYNSARVFAPLFLVFLFITNYKYLLTKRRQTLTAILIFILMLLPLASFVLSGQGSARYKLVSLSDDPGLIPRIDEARNNSTLPPVINRLVNNRVTYLSVYFAENYLSHFTPDFLFISGAGHKQHNVQNMGELYVWQAPFVLAGLYLLFKRKEKYRWILIVWLLISIIPVATTRDSIPNALRTIIALPVYEIFTALGVLALYELLQKKNFRIRVASAVVFIVFVVSGIFFYLDNYFTVYPVLYSRDWQYGYKEVMGYVKDHYADYDQIVVTRSYGEPHMFTLFYLGWDPADFQNNSNLVRYQSYDWVWVERFDKFYFPDLGDKGTKFEDIKEKNAGKKMLFVGKPGDFPESMPRLDQVYFLDGTLAFEIVEVK